MSVAGEIGLRLRGGDARALGVERALGFAHRGVGLLRRPDLGVQAAVRIDQRAVRGRIGQRALVVLAVDLDQRRGERAQGLHAHALVVDVGAGASVGELDPAEDQLVADLDVLALEQRMGGVSGRKLEHRGHLALRLAVADEAAVAARAERQRQRVEQDRLARAGLSGEDRQAGREFEIQLIDQNHVADGEAREHGRAGSAQDGTTVW